MNIAHALRGAAIGVMCTTGPHEILLAIRSCGGHRILLDQFGVVRGAPTPVTPVALVIDVDHPNCDEAFDAAATARMPVLGWAVRKPPAHRRARLKAMKIPLLVDVDAYTLCEELVAAIAHTHGGM